MIEDKKKKEEADVRNSADALINASEKAVKQAGDAGVTVTDDQKKAVEDGVADLKKALEGTDVEEIKAKTEALQNAVYPISEALYKKAAEAAQAQQNANAGQNADAQNSNSASGDSGDTTVKDADFTD